MTESTKKTDLQGNPLPKEKPGPKPKPWSRNRVAKTHLSEAEYTRLVRLAQHRNLDLSAYLRWLVDRDWDLMGHRTDRARPTKHTRKRS